MTELEKIKDDTVKKIQKLLSSEDINASNQLSNSLRGEVNENEKLTTFKVFALKYIDRAISGTPPGEQFESLYQNLKRWVLLGKYGIDPASKTAAYFIARKISSEGSKKYREPGLAKTGIERYNEIIDDTITEVTAAAAGTAKAKLIEKLKAQI